MPSLAALTSAGAASETVLFEGEKVLITFNRNVITPDFLQRYARAAREAAAVSGDPVVESQLAQADSLAEVLISWDLTATDDDTEPMPITSETVRGLPSMFIAACWAAMREEARPPDRSSGSFASG